MVQVTLVGYKFKKSPAKIYKWLQIAQVKPGGYSALRFPMTFINSLHRRDMFLARRGK
jgi:hypothetical protein